MASLQSDFEYKQADTIIRGDKDDFKRQSVELRKGRALAADNTNLLSADPLAPAATVPLEPTVQAPRKIEHTSTADLPFSSIPDSNNSASSGPAMMQQVGEQAGAGIEAAKAKLQPLIEPVVNKATSIYDQWKSEHPSDENAPSIQERATAAGADIKERATVAASQAQTVYREQVAPALTDAANKAGPMLSNAINQAKPMLAQASAQAKPLLAQASAQAQVAAANARPVIEHAIEQAKPILANAAATATKIYNEQVQPVLASGLKAAQEELHQIQEDGLSVTMDKANSGLQRRVTQAKTTVIETYESKVPLEQRQQIAKAEQAAEKQAKLLWTRLINVWQTQALPFIRERKLQAPLAIAGAVLTLLLGWSLLHALSANKASHEQVVVYQPNWRPSNGPVQGVEMPGLLDKANAQIHNIDNKIIDGIDTIKARTADLAQHAEDSIAMGIDSIKVKAQELKENIPSTADIKSRTNSAINQAKSSIPSTEDVKAAASPKPSVLDNIKSEAADLKDRVNSAIHPKPASTIDNLKANAADLKDRVNAAIHPKPASTIDNLKANAADIKERINTAIHPKPASTIDQLKASAADIKEQINSAIHPKPASTTDNLKAKAADIKDRVNAAIHPKPASTIDNLKANAADLKDRVESTLDSTLESAKLQAENLKLKAEAGINSARASIPSTADIKASTQSTIESAKASTQSASETIAPKESTISQLRLKINDRLEHVKALLPEQISALRLRLGNLYERLTPAQRHYAHAHPEILDPENHAVSFVDEHGNAKSILDVDLE